MAVPELPPALSYLWTAFWRIRRRRTGGGFGPAAITWADIGAFSQLSGMRFAPWEIEAIELLDDAWLASQAKKDEDAD